MADTIEHPTQAAMEGSGLDGQHEIPSDVELRSAKGAWLLRSWSNLVNIVPMTPKVFHSRTGLLMKM